MNEMVLLVVFVFTPLLCIVHFGFGFNGYKDKKHEEYLCRMMDKISKN